MGRELRRVPLDFDAPLNKVWKGFINPHNAECPEAGKTCFGGTTAAHKWLDSLCRLMSVMAGDAVEAPYAEEYQRTGRRIYPHPYLADWPQVPQTEWPRAEMHRISELPQPQKNLAIMEGLRKNPPKPLPLTPELLTFLEGLAGEKASSMMGSGFDWKLAKKLKAAAGITDENWGICQVCKGHCIDPAVYEAHEAWKETPPPKGDGFQLWSTTTEGSPISPVFSTIEALCEWCATGATTFGYERATATEWREMLDANFVRHEETAADGTKLVFM